jgi:putative transposase
MMLIFPHNFCCYKAYKGYLKYITTHQESGIWQRCFWEHYICDKINFKKHVDYIYYNPFKHGYVKQIIDLSYSTFHRDVKATIYLAHWVAWLMKFFLVNSKMLNSTSDFM